MFDQADGHAPHDFADRAGSQIVKLLGRELQRVAGEEDQNVTRNHSAGRDISPDAWQK